ncbi:bifunctional 23S rRNA (guanine(2069)-N(7))-methyltransferase RlmK/23S rRNA (guanine(2445)-N(2))-methyltransferase RlmL [Pelovirga terrestris]|uniref:Ribosomal RNA large subunit methyltransferase K/L n=1 Tax=Pelovirga terrestris TaxID=2771352 RepID=A0A8J6UIT0_9BACT|nr:bifunctional 23S rRNA (guanine(2069)-N(7))-methyltransferase RlmK/23S rRNA (guanine(2445)-N(2))-methyltransferase RlmL [Pelovirga terrestris]MBD1401655.1 bifunctional 23S rRNA (guanine(2069)-N(7))-methyltransferase RlmK/23S rRNA (guanine(2445)-N(2))-methyltransferase RlmL [Pelovirga terrestris]
MKNNKQSLFVTAALGLEPLLVEELLGLGLDEVKQERAGVRCHGSLADAYRICMWSRLASRVLLPLTQFAAADPDQLYAGVQGVDWSEHMDADSTLAIDCATSKSQITHSRYAEQKTKDAIVDQFRVRTGARPSVSLERPDVRLNLYLYQDQASLSLDLSGESLHRRGYRVDGVHAPLKENLAAGMLLRCGWPQISAAGGALVDPLCGSGTLPLEAALMATNTAPGLLRTYYGFLGWKQHQDAIWQEVRQAADEKHQVGIAVLKVPIIGYDADPRAIRAAWDHARQAGMDKLIHFERRRLDEFVPPSGVRSGLLIANPPYGERLGNSDELAPLYNQLGQVMAQQCPGWHAGVITSEQELGRAIGLRADKINVLYNGALKCQLLQFVLNADNHWQSLSEKAQRVARKPLSAGAEMFANRLRKNLKKLGKWAQREGVDCYRLYDADLPEYAVAVDLYGDEVHLQEYRAPSSIDPDKAAERIRDVLAALPRVLDITPDQIHLKVRRQQKGTDQYEKQARRGILKEVHEGNCRFLVNLTDYLDTGLFLDHRMTRRKIQSMAAGKRFLNLFGYTGAATVHALKGGASATTTVDMSRTYLDWARRNIELNGFPGNRQEFVQADCLAWLEQAQTHRAGVFDLIFLDPPSFSNSKSMATTFDVQRDHVELLRHTLRLLADGGQLIFSTNLRTFQMAVEAFDDLSLENITASTLPADFARNPRIHQCWLIRKI